MATHEEPGVQQVLLRVRQELDRVRTAPQPSKWVEIPISRGLYALCDKKYERELLKYTWWAEIARGGHIYARTDINGHRVAMQRLVYTLVHPGYDLASTKNVSFANKCTLDCRSFNLRDRPDRVAAMRNRRKKRGSSSPYKGVRKKEHNSGRVGYAVSIGARKGVVIYLGEYSSESFAAEVYDAAAALLFEGAAHPNFPHTTPSTLALENAVMRINRWRTKQDRTKVQQDSAKGGPESPAM